MPVGIGSGGDSRRNDDVIDLPLPMIGRLGMVPLASSVWGCWAATLSINLQSAALEYLQCLSLLPSYRVNNGEQVVTPYLTSVA